MTISDNTVTLPPLPEADGEIVIQIIGRDVPVDAYRPSTVLDFARAAILEDRKATRAAVLEEAAGMADKMIDPEWPNDDLSVQAQDIASAIRSLSSSGGGEG